MTDYLHTSVQERGSTEGHRENANAINHLLDEVTSLDERLTVTEDLLKIIEAIGKEQAVLRGSTTITAGTITDYTSSWKPSPPQLSESPQLITLDETDGTITVGYAGIYSLSGYLAQTGGNNNDTIVININGSVIGNVPIGTGTWNNQTGGLIYTAQFTASLAAGEVITLTSTSTDPGTIAGTNLHVELQTLDAFT